jgi:hypothetical protein
MSAGADGDGEDCVADGDGDDDVADALDDELGLDELCCGVDCAVVLDEEHAVTLSAAAPSSATTVTRRDVALMMLPPRRPTLDRSPKRYPGHRGRLASTP